jgi:hypothetical protein
MNRRDFLKVGSVISVFGLIAASPLDKVFNAEMEVSAFGKIYRAANKGRVFVSKDKGKSWQLHTRFNNGYSILDIFVATDKRLYVKLGYNKTRFYLVLTGNKKSWLAETFQTQPTRKA